jgi:AcrR family transcriptional regulator
MRRRAEVLEAVLDAVGELVMSRGLWAVTMSQLAESTGISRATLYKYVGDVEEVLTAWHQRHVASQRAELTEIAGAVRRPCRPAATRAEGLRRHLPAAPPPRR